MSAQLLSSKLVVQEEAATSPTPAAVATGVTACVGITKKGPVGVATLLTSFDDFVRIFGGDIANGIAASAVRGFFAGGGERMYFTRVVHFSDITNPLSKTSAKGTLTLSTASFAPMGASVTGAITGPFALVDGDTLTIDRDAAGQSTATFNGTAATLTNGPAPYDPVSDGQTLEVRIDGGATQTLTFVAADFLNLVVPTAAEIATAIAAKITGATVALEGGVTRITSNTLGTSSGVEIVGGTAMAALGFGAQVATGTGNVQDLGAVTVAEIKAVVEAAISGVTVSDSSGAVRITADTLGVTGLIQVVETSTADDELGLPNTVEAGLSGASVPTLRIDAKYDGAYSSSLKVVIAAATSRVPSEFNMLVQSDGVTVESYSNLTMLDGAERHVETIVNAASRFIEVADLDANPSPTGALAERPGNSPGSPAAAFGPLVGGDDGLVGLTEVDFTGDASSGTGFYSFDLVSDVELLICPELATPGVHNAGLSYVSVHRNGEMFFIADPPAGMSGAQINEYVLATAALKNTTEFGAIYWPRVKVVNPNAALYGSSPTITVPPSGHIAGMFARNDGSVQGGVYLPPGGVERGQLPGVIGLESDDVLNERIRDLISPNCINPITRLRGKPICVNDVMTLAPAGIFPTIAERRGVIYIERVIKDTLEFARMRNNDQSLRNMIDLIVTGFLRSQMKLGAFRSTDPSAAFFVDTSTAINPPSEVFAGRVNVRIGLATQKPARFVILSFSQDTRALDQELATAG